MLEGSSLGKVKMANINLTEELSKIASANLKKDFTGKYYLAMGFDDDPSLSKKHITIVYFAEQPKENLQKIIDIVDDYIDKNGFKSFEIDFDKVEMFGPGKDIKVVRPGTPDDKSDLFLPKLKNVLYEFNNSKFKDAPYKPHVTTDNDREGGRVNRLVLATGNTIVKKWTPTQEKSAEVKAQHGTGNLDHSYGGAYSQDTNENAAPWDLSQGSPVVRGFKKKATIAKKYTSRCDCRC